MLTDTLEPPLPNLVGDVMPPSSYRADSNTSALRLSAAPTLLHNNYETQISVNLSGRSYIMTSLPVSASQLPICYARSEPGLDTLTEVSITPRLVRMQ